MSVNDEKILNLIDQIDKAVDKKGAAVKLSEYGGGPDESKIIANRKGYLRLGIEFLKAAYADPIKFDDEDQNQKEEIEDIEVEIDYLLVPESKVNFDWFQRTENIKEPLEYKETLKNKIIGFGVLGFFIGTIIFAFIGLVSIIRYLF